MRIWGLTGGIGMGKSAAAQILTANGVAVVDTDVLARQLTQRRSEALAEIVGDFGASYLNAEGDLDRVALAKLVFEDSTARTKLESILHPRIRSAWKAQLDRWREQGVGLAVVVIPLLFETAAQSEFDSTICVSCSSVSQRARLRERRWDENQISQRIAAQWPIEKKMAAANYVIWSEGSLAVTEEQLFLVIR